MAASAYFSPLPPERSGIADYSEELLPYLAKSAQVTLFASDPEQVSAELRALSEVRPIADYPDRRIWQYDIALYHMGNSMYHEALYRVLLRYPGITVLHDHGLHHFMATRTIPQGDFAGYAREMGYALGTNGVDLAYRSDRDRPSTPLYTVPLNERVLDHSLGVIVHSHYVARCDSGCASRIYPLRSCRRRSAPILARCVRDRSWGVLRMRCVFVSAGQVIPHKQVTSALEAFARLRVDFPQARYVVVGDELEAGSGPAGLAPTA